jgi:hypothetical protein
MIIVERVPYTPFGSKELNTANHPRREDDQEAKGLDYNTEVDKTCLHRWKDIIEYPVLFEYTFTDEEACILVDAAKCGIITKRMSKVHKEELMEITCRLENHMKKLGDTLPTTGLFFRFSGASPKDGRFSFPVMGPREMVEQIATSNRARNCLQFGDKTIYVCKFDHSWDPTRELRVFVRKGSVTAISQYCCFTEENPFSRMSDEDLVGLAKSLKVLLAGMLDSLSVALECDSFVCDVYVNQDMTLRVIEFNSFGYWLASGSALFHWLNDYSKLYNENGNTYVRVLQ